MGTRKTTSSSARRKESSPTLFTSTADLPTRPPQFALPSDIATSLRYLDDAELQRLQVAVEAEIGRRKRDARSDDGFASRASRPVPSPVATTKVAEIPEGRANLIRASFDAGLKPATIARTFGVSPFAGKPHHSRRAEIKQSIRPARLRPQADLHEIGPQLRGAYLDTLRCV